MRNFERKATGRAGSKPEEWITLQTLARGDGECYLLKIIYSQGDVALLCATMWLSLESVHTVMCDLDALCLSSYALSYI